MTGPAQLPPLPDPARVCVVLPARHAGVTVAIALRSILDQHPPVDEVAVACDSDDTSTRDAVAPILRADPRVRLVDAPGGRTPDALNAAIAATTGEVVVRVDAHAELPPGYVARAVATLRETGAANVGGKQAPGAATGFGRAVANAMTSPAGAGGAAYRTGDQAGPVDTVYLGVFRREALEAAGGYAPQMTRNQDAELNLRLTAAGYTVWFDPELSVVYAPRDRVRSLASQYWQYGRWRRATAALHPSSLRARQLAAPLLVSGLLVAAIAATWTGRWLVLLAPLAAYLLGLLVAGAAASDRVRDALPTAVALGTMHLAWGLGFLAGPPRGVVQSSVGSDDP